ncbi:MAG: cystathionine gamma-synthase family protein [Elusimicrobia bacterium]|nr:cystathionine gamma-synthase family protein [Elusimicrobiota bacterium]
MTKRRPEGYIKGRPLKPESLMMTYGYKPELSEGSLKCPIFQTSTFVFKSAEEGKAFFEIAYGLREQGPKEELGLIYSRLNNPDLEILEDRLCLWDGADSAAVFESGMAAISTLAFEFLRPGTVVLHSEPIYGGTEYFFRHILPRYGIKAVGFPAGADEKALEKAARAAGRVAMIFVETPSNPTNKLVDIRACAHVAKKLSTKENRVTVAVDNTFLGPLWQHPLKLGADFVLYSATKFIGGHSDVIAGVCLGGAEDMKRVRTLRTFLGTLSGPWNGWLLLRSLETLKLRMTCQMKNAQKVADFLADHPKVEKVYYLGHLEEGSAQRKVYERQCLAPGSMISFDIKGGEKQAFKFLNSLELFSLAVSLGGTESLAEHPGTMTHSDVPPADQARMGITPKMVRLSIGVENPEDLIADLTQALDSV